MPYDTLPVISNRELADAYSRKNNLCVYEDYEGNEGNVIRLCFHKMER
jgi:hypothetical protein